MITANEQQLQGYEEGLNKEEKLAFRQFVTNEEVLMNLYLGRSGFLEQISGENRSIDRDCGYPDTAALSITQYKEMYDRNPIAARVVEVMPDESWKMNPTVFETEEPDPDKNTPFEDDWTNLSLSLRGASKFKQKEGNPIWEYLHRVDVLSGIGHYGILFLGLNDGLPLEQPVEPRENMELMFLRAFDESSAKIDRYDEDQRSTRFALPEMYSITFSTPIEDRSVGVGVQSIESKVHWSRVIHVADNLGSNEVFGVPRERPVYNNLLDCKKLYGGSAEMYWRGAFPGISFETHPQLGGRGQMNTSKLESAIEKYMQGLQRWLALRGMTAKSLAPQVVDPTAQIEVQLDAICIKLAIPKRKFLGSERGELASSQDADEWDEVVAARNTQYVTPRIVVPFIDRLIDLKILTEPEEYSVTWPTRDTLNEDQKAIVMAKRTESMVKYLAGDVQQLMSPLDYLTRIMGFDQEEAKQIVDAAEDAFEELERDRLEKQQQQQELLGGPVEDGGTQEEEQGGDNEEDQGDISSAQ